jgi:predicted dehydrogenase
MGTTLQLGIIGSGYIADVIATALRETDRVQLAAVASRRPEAARDFARRHGDVPVYESWEALIADPSIGAVYVATPTSVREGICIAAAKHGKHVLGEKPFASRASLKAITDACLEHGVAFLDATHFTHHPRTHQIRAELPQRIGRLEAIRTSFFFPSSDRNNIRLQPDKEPTGAIGDMAWYSMRAIAEYADAGSTVVHCHGVARRDPVTGAFIRGAGVLQLSDGLTCTWDAGYTVGACLMDLDLMGEKGVIQMDDFVLDWSGGFLIPDNTRPVGFTQRTGLATPAGFERVETPSPKRQVVRMLENFAEMTLDPGGDAVVSSIRRSERTQALVDTVFANLEF